jgi:hypothetical protein
MWNVLQRHAARHALTYLIALLLGMTASLTAVYDNFWPLEREDWVKLGWWQLVAVTAKCVAPFGTTVVAYLIKSPLSENESTGKPDRPRAVGD